ncbi:nuclear transport factor 2 family protein [Streptomyces sp. NBC_00343]|uniref:nuclear transport factor 2 family protein n=1 Tax=Streptomyces sp. NBC_00343 TaxID=2975719 RepID=UPI002E2BAD45|nr:nuclear transport factor 2 family protein [Streptomyces sp. NBC_00343]
MALDNEQIVRQAREVAEKMNMAGWAAAFTEEGTFTDSSIGVTWKGPAELPTQVENYHRAFPDMHRELFRFYSTGNIVVVQLALQGTRLGPLHLPAGTLPATGKRIDAPCCDVFPLPAGAETIVTRCSWTALFRASTRPCRRIRPDSPHPGTRPEPSTAGRSIIARSRGSVRPITPGPESGRPTPGCRRSARYGHPCRVSAETTKALPSTGRKGL